MCWIFHILSLVYYTTTLSCSSCTLPHTYTWGLCAHTHQLSLPLKACFHLVLKSILGDPITSVDASISTWHYISACISSDHWWSDLTPSLYIPKNTDIPLVKVECLVVYVHLWEAAIQKNPKITPSRPEKEEKKPKKNLAGKSKQHTAVEMFEAFAVYLYGLL